MPKFWSGTFVGYCGSSVALLGGEAIDSIVNVLQSRCFLPFELNYLLNKSSNIFEFGQKRNSQRSIYSRLKISRILQLMQQLVVEKLAHNLTI